MSEAARFGVDPGELLDAAAAAAEVAESMAVARQALTAVDHHAWAEDVGLAADAGRAVDALATACDLARSRATQLEEALRVASESYARSDRWWER